MTYAPGPRPRILQVVSHLALGGAEQVAVTLIESLRNQFDFALHATQQHATPDAVGESFTCRVRELGIPVFSGTRLDMKHGGMLTGALALSKSVERFAPDLVHLNTEIPEACFAALLSGRRSLRPLPLIRTIHSTSYWKFWRPLGRWSDRRLAHGAIAGVSESALAAFRELRKESGAAPPKQLPVRIYNGVKTPARPKLKETSLSARPVRLVFGGRFESEKGADLLPAIIANVPAPAGGAELVIYGQGRYEPALRALGQRPPSGWSIVVNRSVADFAARLGEFDLLLVPSRNEGLSLQAIEASLAQTPVIATDAPGLREALPPDYPWLATAGSAAAFATTLSRAFTQMELWPKVGREISEHAARLFNVPDMSAAYRRLYLAALKGPDTPCQRSTHDRD